MLEELKAKDTIKLKCGGEAKVGNIIEINNETITFSVPPSSRYWGEEIIFTYKLDGSYIDDSTKSIGQKMSEELKIVSVSN
ncbi:hypothetical protein KAR91_83850 [Candidatus Pacearchaeota archaeon]|nr:hypothetical protein [Candidatus Pacearchaeota archaeon]